MKNIILFLILITSCNQTQETKHLIKDEQREITATEFVHDSCEYVVFEGNNSLLRYGAASHKGNCLFCMKRQKQMMREFLKEYPKNK